MEIQTTRFGPLAIDWQDLLQFPSGLMGIEECRQWVVLQDAENDAVAWLQSAERPAIAVAVVSPRRFVPDYRIRVARVEIEPLELGEVRLAEVLVIVGRTDRSITLNLRAPLLLNLSRRLGRQVITNGDLPIRYEIGGGQVAWKKIA